jgi:hypothetical protein
LAFIIHTFFPLFRILYCPSVSIVVVAALLLLFFQRALHVSQHQQQQPFVLLKRLGGDRRWLATDEKSRRTSAFKQASDNGKKQTKAASWILTMHNAFDETSDEGFQVSHRHTHFTLILLLVRCTHSRG